MKDKDSDRIDYIMERLSKVESDHKDIFSVLSKVEILERMEQQAYDSRKSLNSKIEAIDSKVNEFPKYFLKIVIASLATVLGAIAPVLLSLIFK